MSPAAQLKATKIADALGLEWSEDDTWKGRIDDLKVVVVGGTTREEGDYARITVTMPRSLRLGLLANTGPHLGAAIDTIAFDHARLDSFLVLGAAEPEVARAILVACADPIVALQGAVLAIDDRTISLTEHAFYSVEVFAQQVPAMIALAHRLLRERGEWEARFETAIEPVWSRLAAEAEMEWDAERSRITGEIHGARFDAQVTSAPGALAVRVRSRWPSLERGLQIEEEARPPTEAPAHARPRDWPSDEPLSYDAWYATRLVASAGASLTLDDEGAVARLPDLQRALADHDVPMERVFRAMRTLTRELLAPPTTSGGLYR